MSGLRLDPAWLAALRARADRAPRCPRWPLWAGSAQIGSVEPDLFDRLDLAEQPDGSPLLAPASVEQGPGWLLHGDVTTGLAQIALALRQGGLAHVWRDEQLAVTDAQGKRLGTVERAVVRPLGIATQAVHLVGRTRDGRHWVQQRALTKANDPGLWDTLMGGMVSAADTLGEALARETWEEAGLRPDQLAELRQGGRVHTRWPCADAGGRGYLVEHIDWFDCVVPDGVTPVNQDGEVAQFALMDNAELALRLARDEFTTEAALILASAAGL